MIVCDTREKRWEHIENYFIKNNIEYVSQKLDYGDYMDSLNPMLSVDRKRNFDEVAQNLLSKDSSRFWREIRGARKNNIHIIVLVEHGGKYKELMDVVNWKSKYSSLDGRRLVEKMLGVSYAYGVEWVFCDKRSTGKRIVELLSNDRRRD